MIYEKYALINIEKIIFNVKASSNYTLVSSTFKSVHYTVLEIKHAT